MRAKKQNKEYTITAAEAKGYQARGFDIYDDSGKLVQVGAGKTVSYAKYQEANWNRRSRPGEARAARPPVSSEPICHSR